MDRIAILKYGIFGYSFIVGIISFAISDDLRNPKIFHKCWIAAIISFVLGIFFEFANIFKVERGMTLLIMSISMIYLVYYRLFLKLFKDWKGVDPCMTTGSSMIGDRAFGGFWTKFPSNRKIMWEDFLFTFVVFLIPIFTFLGLMLIIIEINR